MKGENAGDFERKILKYLYDRKEDKDFHNVYERFEDYAEDIASIGIVVRRLIDSKLLQIAPLDLKIPFNYGTEFNVPIPLWQPTPKPVMWVKITHDGIEYYEDIFLAKRTKPNKDKKSAKQKFKLRIRDRLET